MGEKRRHLLVWDIDDVLNDLMEIWFANFLPVRDVVIRYDELTENPPDALLGITRELYLQSLDNCRAGGFYQRPPRREILEFFKKHGGRFRHIALSAVPIRFAPNSANWVLSHFGCWLQGCLFIPSPRSGDGVCSTLFNSKGDALVQFGENAILIDDSEKNVSDALSRGGKAMLFPAPWNKRRGMSISDFLAELAVL